MLDSFFSLQGTGLLALVAYIFYRLCSHLWRRRCLPPGPKPLPIVGNARDFPVPGVPEFQHWLHHRHLYGPISSVSVFGTTLIIIHDKQAAHDLLEKSSAKTSGRPTMAFAGTMCGYGLSLPFRGYDGGFRRARKMIHQEIGTKALTARFNNVQEAEVCRRLVRALDEPKEWLNDFRTTIGAVVLKSTFGYSIEREKPDTLIAMAELAMSQFSLAAVPMAWAVDVVPALQYLPDWFPGSGFKETARKYRHHGNAAIFTPYRFVERQMAAHTNRPSFTSRLIEHFTSQEGGKTGKLSYETENTIARASAALYGAATDTTAVTFATFTLAMVMFPDVQRKAQGEIERVVGINRLPGIEDWDKLPYVYAVIKETVRWWTVAPMGFPHASDQGLEYQGHHIPKGAYLLPAVWWFLHDPAVYTRPESFEPERFLSPRNEPDPLLEAFGYGRRICPGRFFAEAGLYLNIAKSLAAFDIKKATAPDGTEIDVNVKPQPGVINAPTEFPFQVIPRSPKHVELIREAGARYPCEPSDAELLVTATE